MIALLYNVLCLMTSSCYRYVQPHFIVAYVWHCDCLL